MLKKQNGRGKSVKVTFSLLEANEAESICLLGDFNNWDENAAPLKRAKDGSFSTTVTLEKDREYQFRYLIDGNQWQNDAQADSYVQNPFGGDNSVVTT